MHIYKYDDSLNNKPSHYLFSQSDYSYTPNPFSIIRVDPVKIINYAKSAPLTFSTTLPALLPEYRRSCAASASSIGITA